MRIDLTSEEQAAMDERIKLHESKTSHETTTRPAIRLFRVYAKTAAEAIEDPIVPKVGDTFEFLGKRNVVHSFLVDQSYLFPDSWFVCVEYAAAE